MNKLVITVKENIVYYGYFVDGKAVELYCEKLESPTILGNIYVARVERVAEGIQGAFLEISPSQKAYYNLSPGKKPVKFTPGHEDGLYGGDLILVQVTKDAVKTKLPVVDSNVSISGKYFVISMERKGINLSKKIKKKEERDRLLSIARANSTNDFGLVIRTNAENISEDILVRELRSLMRQTELIMQKGQVAPGKTLIHKDASYYIRLAKELPMKELDEIVTDCDDIFKELKEYYASDSNIDSKIRFYKDEYSLYKLYRMDHYYEMALQRYVPLNSGGSIVIDQTEAMVVIDVNSGAVIKGKRGADSIFSKMNREAAMEIVDQLRLRNLSGIVLIDFINMKEEKERDRFFSFLQNECLRDRIPIRVIDFTALHLVEMTRNKVRKSLKEQWNECHS
ncbi:MAG: ribonuclease E/G [Eubacteriales bacterium]|nr:ribonuclease E/G [Eubacteriales bacterium]